MSNYEVRPYRAGDTDGFLDLYSTVMGGENSREWFDWKYRRNPYVDHVAMIVALNEEAIVGARPFFALPVSVDGGRAVALQPGDAMVHPEHRRQGLFTRMTERAIDRYADDHPFFFNFPNQLSLQGNLKLDWRIVSKRSSHYRIENPVPIAKERADRSTIELASRVATPFVQGYYRLRELATSSTPEISTRVESEPPVGELASLYRTAVPERIHAVRDEQFYRWRLGNPNWDYTAYIADGETGPETAILTGSSVGSGPTTTKFTDVVPLGTASNPNLVSLIDRILSDQADTDLFATPAQGIPHSVLRSFGFHADTTFPISLFATRTTHVVRTLTGDWNQNGIDITDPDNWLLTFVEEDTS